MATTDAIARFLQQPSSRPLSARTLYPSLELGRPPRRRPSSLHATAMATRDDHAAALRKDAEQHGSRSSPGHSLLKAVHEGLAPHAVIQQVSSLGHVFVPELPAAIIKEIKKRIPLISFRDDDGRGGVEGEEVEMLNSRRSAAGESEEQESAMGARCLWPRAKLARAEEVLPQLVVQAAPEHPRCPWPRGSASLPILASKEEDDLLERRKGELANAAQCSWPRATGRKRSLQPMNGSTNSINFTNSQQNANHVSSNSTNNKAHGVSHNIDTTKNAPLGSIESLPNAQGTEWPRCTWPRTTPRRMLATGVGLGLMNYFLVAQSAPALAVFVETASFFTYEDVDLMNKDTVLLT